MVSCLGATVASFSYREMKHQDMLREISVATSQQGQSMPRQEPQIFILSDRPSRTTSGHSTGGARAPSGEGIEPSAMPDGSSEQEPAVGEALPVQGGASFGTADGLASSAAADQMVEGPSVLRSKGSADDGSRSVAMVQLPPIARHGAYISGAPSSQGPAPNRQPQPVGADGQSVFVPSKLGLSVQKRGADVWEQWNKRYERNITGTQGLGQLQQAFALIEDSRMLSVAEDLIRRGVAISFGEASDFSGVTGGALAYFHYAATEAPPSAPSVEPEIRLNPKLLHEHPLILAAALVHEGTHVQQYLDGSLLDASESDPEIEFSAWWNEAAFWEEVRGALWPIDTPIERELEFNYHAALHGEARLRELIEAFQL
jgi:hypothetical protein